MSEIEVTVTATGDGIAPVPVVKISSGDKTVAIHELVKFLVKMAIAKPTRRCRFTIEMVG